jgi:hypothetical protein
MKVSAHYAKLARFEPAPTLNELLDESLASDVFDKPEYYGKNEAQRMAIVTRRYDELRAIFDTTGPLQVFRAIALPNGPESANPTSFGVYWSWEESGAVAFADRWLTNSFIFRGLVSPEDVDWWETFKRHLANSEKELRLTEEATVRITGCKAVGESEWHPAPDTLKTVTAADKTAAPRGIYYHGSSIKNLRSILAEGLVPQVKEKNWNDDPNAGTHTPSRESYGGIYVTQNLMTACAAPRDHVKEGREVLVAMELQPNTFLLDEDNVVFALNAALGRQSENYSFVGQLYFAATNNVPAFADTVANYKADYVIECQKRFKYKFEEQGRKMNEGLRLELNGVLQKAWLPALTRLMVHHYAGEGSDWSLRSCYRTVMGDVDTVPPREELMPTIAKAEAGFRAVADQVTRTLKTLARPHESDFNFTSRVMDPIGYSGSNHILAVIEVQDGRQYTDNWKSPTKLIVHYGTVPEDFFTQWKARKGSEYEVVKPGQKAASQKIANGLPSFDQWLAHSGGVLAVEAEWSKGNGGWEDILKNKGESLDEVPEANTPEYLPYIEKAMGTWLREERWPFVISSLEKLGYPLEVCRALSLENGLESLRTENVGTYWATELYGAKPYWGNDDHPTYILIAKVTEDQIDWFGTLDSRMNYWDADDEHEIRLKSGAVLKDVTVMDDGNNETPLGKIVVASKTAKEHEIESDGAHTNEDGYWAGTDGGASGILAIAKDSRRLCLAWRNEEVHTGDCWGLIGGAVKDGMQPGPSAVAEMKEEVGYAGPVELHAGYVFQDGKFAYHNFCGVTPSEFSFNPASQHAWETDYIEWFTLEDILADMEEHAGDYHPGVITFFKQSRELIEKLVKGDPDGGKAVTASNSFDVEAYRAQGLNVDVRETPTVIRINTLQPPADKPELAREFMEALTEYAERTHKEIGIVPGADYATMNSDGVSTMKRTAAPNDGYEIVYRGEGQASMKNGKFWTPSAYFAVQFTQMGMYEELRRAKIRTADIYEADPLPYGGDPDAIDAAIKAARAQGKKAIRCSEGSGNPPSIWVFNLSALKMVPGKVTEPNDDEEDSPKVSMDTPKTAYLSPKDAELTVTIDMTTRKQVTISLDLGIPRFTRFAITIPVEDLEGDAVLEYAQQAFSAMLDEILAFMLSLNYDRERMVEFTRLAEGCFAGINLEDATDHGMNSTDPNVRMYEANFEIPVDFIEETHQRVVTAGSVVRRLPEKREIQLTKIKTNPIDGNAARAIRLYKNRALKSTPRPFYVVIYDQMGRTRGAIPLATNWESKLLKRV